MYNPNNPSNWSWAKAFDEVEKTIKKAELEQQIMNHLDNYSGDPIGLISLTIKKMITIQS